MSASAPEVISRLGRAYPDARTGLDWESPFQLLVATVLSAQTTDVRVNQVTPGLFGMTNIHGRVTAEVGEKLTAALSAASRPDAEGEVRLPNQRRADALEQVEEEDTGRE